MCLCFEPVRVPSKDCEDLAPAVRQVLAGQQGFNPVMASSRFIPRHLTTVRDNFVRESRLSFTETHGVVLSQRVVQRVSMDTV